MKEKQVVLHRGQRSKPGVCLEMARGAITSVFDLFTGCHLCVMSDGGRAQGQGGDWLRYSSGARVGGVKVAVRDDTEETGDESVTCSSFKTEWRLRAFILVTERQSCINCWANGGQLASWLL